MPDDAELLRCYAETRSEGAFAQLVGRHLPLVYGAALRLVAGDAHLAEDVAQTVFADLARKAPALVGRPVLAGWLHTSVRFAAAKAVRSAQRRRAREAAAQLAETLLTDATMDADWQRMRPVIDEALQALGERDREAVLLRFFEGRSFVEIGRLLALSGDAARLRVERALEKLRGVLARRGVSSTSAALALALANQPAVAIPAGLAGTLTTCTLASATAGGSAGAALAVFTMSKITTGVVAALVIAGLAAAVVELRANRELRGEIEALRAGVDETDALRRERQELDGALQKLGARNPEAEALALARARVAVLKARPPGVDDARMKTAADWRNLGRATPADALETGLWAGESADMESFARSYVFPDEMKAALEKFFAQQSDAVRTRYGTPERLLGQFWWEHAKANRAVPLAFQVVGEKRASALDGDTATLQIWYRKANGEEAPTSISFRRDATGWGIAGHNPTAAGWAKMAARIDQATGEIHPEIKAPPAAGQPR